TAQTGVRVLPSPHPAPWHAPHFEMETGATHPDKIFIAADETSTRSVIQIRFSVSSDRSRYIWGSKKGELPNSSQRELSDTKSSRSGMQNKWVLRSVRGNAPGVQP